MLEQISLEYDSTILIVDDQLSGREVIRGLLSGQGYELAFASNGEEALAQASDLMPDLILLDVMMPGMDGFEVCERLRADNHLAEVPIIMVTALDDQNSRLKGIEAGADDFVTKPFNKAELHVRVRTITRLNRYRRLLLERRRRQAAEEEVGRRNREVMLLKEIERMKDQFVSNVSHELRTPLSIITLLSGNLDTLYERLNDNKRQKMIRDIRRHVEVLDTLIEDILTISRLDAGRVSLEHQRLNLAYLAREEADKQLLLARDKGQTIHMTGIEKLWVSGHDGQLRQVIRNLLNNAIKYTPAGEHITCECSVQTKNGDLEVSWPGSIDLPAGRWAAFRVVDAGIGIEAGDLPHLFERFYRVKDQGNIPGTGLGLSIVQELVELHSGRIAMHSVPGEGSTFAVYLPLAEKE